MPPNITQLLKSTQVGNRESLDEFLLLVYDKLKKIRKSMETDSVSVGQKIEFSTAEQRLGTIYWRMGNNAKAEPIFTHAFELLDYLVKKDAENFDYVKIRGEAKFNYADELLRRGEIEKARRTFQKAFLEIVFWRKNQPKKRLSNIKKPLRFGNKTRF